MNRSVVLGIDIAKAKFDICLRRDNKVVARGTFTNDEAGCQKLDRFLKKRKTGKLLACMEATGEYGELLCQHLHDDSHTVCVVNPQRIRHYAKSQFNRAKTDKLDADLIADFAFSQPMTVWQPRPAEEIRLRALMRRLAALTEARSAELNRRQSASLDPDVADSIEAHIAFLDQQIADLRQRIDDHVDQHPELLQKRDLLTSIPGIGKLTAALILAELPPVSYFSKSKQVAAFAGLTPRPLQSGSSLNRSGRLYKLGSSRLRGGLYMPALTALRFNPPIMALAQRMRDQNKHNLSIIAAAMRKLIVIAYGVLKSGRPFQADLAVNVQTT